MFGKLLFVGRSPTCKMVAVVADSLANFSRPDMQIFGVSNASCLLVFYANFLVSLDKLSVRLNDGT